MKSTENHADLPHILQARQLNMPGLQLLGHCTFSKATPPLPWHDHGVCMELIFLLSGRDSYTVNGAGYELTGNEVFIAFPGERHKSSGAYQGIGEYIWMQLDTRPHTGFLNLSSAAAGKLRQALQKLERHRYAVSPAFMGLVKEFYQAVRQRREPTLCSAMLVYLLSRLVFQEIRRDSVSDEIGPILTFLHAHFRDSSLSVAQVAHAFGLSESGLQHRFKKTTGDTLVRYLTRIRLQHAKTLLEKGESVLTAAVSSGFTSSEYFSVVFKKYNLVSPSAYRKVCEKDGPGA